MDNQIINAVMEMVVIPVMGIVAGVIVAFLRKKTLEVKNKIKNENISKYIDIANDAVCTAVTSTAQIFVDAKKKNGTFDAAAQAEAFEQTKQKALTILSDATKTELMQLHGDFNTWLDSKIEHYVSVNKGATSTVQEFKIPAEPVITQPDTVSI